MCKWRLSLGTIEEGKADCEEYDQPGERTTHLIYGNFISRLKKDFKLTSGNLMLLALLKVGFTSSELMFTFDCEMNSIFTKKRRLRGILSLDTNDKLEEFVALY